MKKRFKSVHDRMLELLKRNFDDLDYAEKIELISYKYYEKMKITYEEYVLLALTNDEIWFYYNDKLYQIDHGLKNVTAMYVTEFKNKEKISEQSIEYKSVIDLLSNFRVDGKKISEIWDKVKY